MGSVGERIGFGAQAVQKVSPEAVTANASGYLMVNYIEAGNNKNNSDHER